MPLFNAQYFDFAQYKCPIPNSPTKEAHHFHQNLDQSSESENLNHLINLLFTLLLTSSKVAAGLLYLSKSSVDVVL